MKAIGSKVTLRSITDNDLRTLWALIYGEENPEWKKWDAPYYPHHRVDYETFRDSIHKRLSSTDVPSMVIIEINGEVVGTVSYYWEHQPSWWLEIGIVIYKPEFWSGGYGTDALKLWINYLFSSMPLVRIGLTTWSGNYRMVKSAEKLGMQMEARIRKARLYDGEFYDSIRMGMLREEWKQIAVENHE